MKTFKQMCDEEIATMNTGSGIAGLPPDPPPVGLMMRRKKKKRKPKILTRNYIEVAGKRRRLYK